MKYAHAEYLVDGCLATVMPSGDWDLTLPSGKHVTGSAKTVDEGKAALKAKYEQLIIARWKRGWFGRDRQFICPLDVE